MNRHAAAHPDDFEERVEAAVDAESKAPLKVESRSGGVVVIRAVTGEGVLVFQHELDELIRTLTEMREK